MRIRSCSAPLMQGLCSQREELRIHQRKNFLKLQVLAEPFQQGLAGAPLDSVLFCFVFSGTLFLYICLLFVVLHSKL